MQLSVSDSTSITITADGIAAASALLSAVNYALNANPTGFSSDQQAVLGALRTALEAIAVTP